MDTPGPRSWLLIPLSNKKELGFLGKMADSGFGTGYTQNDPGASYSASKKMLKNGTKQMKKNPQ